MNLNETRNEVVSARKTKSNVHVLIGKKKPSFAWNGGKCVKLMINEFE